MYVEVHGIECAQYVKTIFKNWILSESKLHS